MKEGGISPLRSMRTEPLSSGETFKVLDTELKEMGEKELGPTAYMIRRREGQSQSKSSGKNASYLYSNVLVRRMNLEGHQIELLGKRTVR